MLLGGIGVFGAVFAALLCGLTGSFHSPAWLWVLPLGFLGGVVLAFGLAFLIIWLMSAAVKLDEQQEKDSPLYRRVADMIVDAAITIFRIKIHTRGLEKIPKEGRFLLVCNHLNDTDPAFLLKYFRNSQLAFISKREVDEMFLIGKYMRKLLCQPINRENDREALKTIIRCIQILKEDKASVAVFPEGYIKGDNKLHRFRSGVFKIAQKAEVPIVVCTLQNTQTVLKNMKKLKPIETHLHVLDVIPAAELKGVTTVDIANRIYKLMAEDLGPENVAEE